MAKEKEKKKEMTTWTPPKPGTKIVINDKFEGVKVKKPRKK